MLKLFDFECLSCSAMFEAMVEGIEGQPDGCSQCPSTEGFKKLVGVANLPRKIIVDYPGSKRLKAGYQHSHNRKAEKLGRQVSMHGAYKDGK